MNQELERNVKLLINVGDPQYLETILAKAGWKSASHYRKILSGLEKDSVETSICRHGSYEMAKFLRERTQGSFDLDKWSDEAGQTCLHHSVSKNQTRMVKYLLETFPRLTNK